MLRTKCHCSSFDVLQSLSFSMSAFERWLSRLPDLKSFNARSVLKSSFGLSETRGTDVVLKCDILQHVRVVFGAQVSA
jgi:hypothetical protein